MPFTSETLLLTRISQDQIDAVKGTESVYLIAAVAEADATITAATGITPLSTATDNHKTLTAIASRLVIWILSGRVQGLTDDEAARRRKDYEDALKDLEKVKSGDLALTVPSTTTVATVSSQPRRITEY